MSDRDNSAPRRFRLLATHLAGRSLEIAEAAAGETSYTNGRVIFVTVGGSADDQRREVRVQAALLGAGSLDPRYVKALRGRRALARRYLAVEGRRVLGVDEEPLTSSANESLEVARSRTAIVDPPPWFGVIRPSVLLRTPGGAGGAATKAEADEQPDEDADEGDETFEESKILKLFHNPVLNSTMLSDFLRKVFGGSRSESDEEAGAEIPVRSIRRTHSAGPQARPVPTRIAFTDADRPGATVGMGGALHPEWDVFADCYRADWCRVIDYPMTTEVDDSAGAMADDPVLRRRLARVGLTHRVLRRRADGDDLDTDALIDFVVEMRSGNSPPETVYTERRMVARELGVLILLDASGSANDADADGRAVHEHQRRAAATLAATLEELGDRVAVYAFRSHGRHAVHLPAIKTFHQRFGVTSRARVNQLRPSGYTRLGAAIRGAGEILKRDAGTPRRLLVVLSDGFPYDDGYEGRYAEADTRRALLELRADGVACLCLSIGAATETTNLERVFGTTSHASAPTLSDLSPRMDELLLSSLRELSVATGAAPTASAPKYR
ncbi:nitric oxide reductase activation protein NorD [Mycolicibacterium sp. P1-5]|uniref:nitric oxide reductase activation protein NorD n=1 Tax=Mycolicibacterium sp. P1-5 TaxID=2024617 RepID=UPI0011ED3F63|nr:VWA domain-containing protein [Mycolicibacterium sp. P1-5]KAA0111778.1 VWA domain-containing protein [Mycolicibacterium sp. P1-5]